MWFSFSFFFYLPKLLVLCLREQNRTLVQQRKCRVEQILEPCSKPNLQNGFCRRELLLFGVSSPLLTVLPSSGKFCLVHALEGFKEDGNSKASSLGFIMFVELYILCN